MPSRLTDADRFFDYGVPMPEDPYWGDSEFQIAFNKQMYDERLPGIGAQEGNTGQTGTPPGGFDQPNMVGNALQHPGDGTVSAGELQGGAVDPTQVETQIAEDLRPIPTTQTAMPDPRPSLDNYGQGREFDFGFTPGSTNRT